MPDGIYCLNLSSIFFGLLVHNRIVVFYYVDIDYDDDDRLTPFRQDLYQKIITGKAIFSLLIIHYQHIFTYTYF